MNSARVRSLWALLVVAACDQAVLQPQGTASLALDIIPSGPSLIPYATASVRVDGPVSRTMSAARGGTLTFSDLPFGSYVVSAEGSMAGVVVWYDESTVVLSAGGAAGATLQDRAFDAPTPTVSSQAIGSGQQVRVTWVAVRGATQYSVEWSQAGAAGTNSMTTAQTNADLTLSSQGTYSVRVRPMTRSGAPGPFSATPATVAVMATIAPSNLTANANSTSQIDLSWTDNSTNETGFAIERCGGAGCSNFAAIDTVGANTTRYQNTGLISGSSYSYRVRTYNGDGNSTYSITATAITSGAAPPNPPSNLTATAVSSSQIELSWTDNSTNETGFKIERCIGADCATFLEMTTVGANTTTYANGGLSPASGFSYRVRAFNNDGISSYSNTGSAVTSPPPPPPPPPPSPPSAPSNLGATAASSSQINLSWTDNSSNEAGFRIERCSGAGCTSFAEIATVGANTTTYQNTGLTPSTSYGYRVRTYNGDGSSSYSITATATTPGAALPPPPSPSNLAGTAVSPSQINLSWTDNSSNETGFRIERCSGAGCTSFAEIATVGANTATYQSTGLTPSTSYGYRVRAYNGDGSSSYSNSATATTPGAALPPPPSPSNLAGTAVSPSQINLSWTDNSSNETGFRIERCSGAGCTSFAEIATVGANTATYQSTGLTPSTSYRYRVRAYNGDGNSSYSNTATATTPETPPSAPSNLAGTASKDSRIKLSWTDASSNETGFRIERCSGAGCTSFAEIATVGPNEKAYQDKELNSSTSYSYRVRAYNGGGNSGYSNTATATP